VITVRTWHGGGYYTWTSWPRLVLQNGVVIAWFWWRWCQRNPEDVEFRDVEETHHRMAA
jgi:hypothetical protein